MSLLGKITSFIKTEIFGVEETNTKSNGVGEKTNTPVIEVKTEAPVDKFENKSPKEDSTETDNSSGLKAMKQTLENIPSKHFDIKKMLKDGLLTRITGISEKEFNTLSNAQKKMIFDATKAAIEKFEQLMQEGKINKNADPEKLVETFASILYEALNSGDFSNAQEFQAEMGNVVEELGEDFDKQTKEIQQRRAKASRIKHDKKMQEELEKIKDLPEEERNIAERRIRRRYNHIRRGRFADITAQRSSEAAVNSMIVLSSKDMAYGAATIIETRCSAEEKTKTADYADYNHTTDLIKAYKEIDDSPNAEALKDYTQTFMAQKSKEAAYQYQTDYKSDRDKFELALQKQRNGEPLTAEEKELLSYMTQEYYTATAQGIGQGALNNVNMTNDEKAEFITKWESDAKQYNDYKEVVQNVKDEIKNNPEHKEIKNKIEKIQQQKPDTGKAETEYTKQPTQVPKGPNETVETIKAKQVYSAAENNTTLDRPKSKTITTQNVFKTSDVKQIANEIKEYGLSETIKKYGEDVIEVILEDPTLNHLRPTIRTIIKGYSLNKLKKLTKSCSDSSFVYICSIVNDDLVSNLKKTRELTKGLCYNAEKQIENIEGENAAA